MSLLNIPSKGFFFWSILYRSDLIEEQAIIDLMVKDNFLIRREDFLPQANYYSKEMGDESSLKKFFLVSYELKGREDLVQEKLRSVELEIQHAEQEKRAINIDPGFLSLENILLTSGKNYGHRVYVLDGVFYELELIYTKKSYEKLPWTYPDYQTPEVLEFFNWNRQLLIEHLSQKKIKNFSL